MRDGGGWVLVGSAVFKTVVRGEEPLGCVRFAHASAITRLTDAWRVVGSCAFRMKGGNAVSRRRVAVIVLAVAMSGVLSGCTRLEAMFMPEPKVVTIEATVAAPGASVVGDLASWMPEGTPLWPGSRVEDSQATKTAYNLTLVTPDPYADVLAGTAKGFEDAGWDAVQAEEGQEGARTAVLTVSNSTHEGLVTLAENADGTVTITYVLTKSAR